MKAILSALALTLSAGTALASQPGFECLDWAQAQAQGRMSPLMQAMRAYASKMSSVHPELAMSVGVGSCRNLTNTSVQAVATGTALTLPTECQGDVVGLTFLAKDAQDMVERAKLTTVTNDAYVDGANGAAIVDVAGTKLKLPICMENFSGGGPQ